MKRMTRRTFLKHTSLATGAVAALAPRARVLGANDELCVAVVGFNSQGKTHLRALRELSGVKSTPRKSSSSSAAIWWRRPTNS